MRALFGSVGAAVLAIMGLMGTVGQAGLTKHFAETSQIGPRVPESDHRATPERHFAPAVAGWLAKAD